PAPAAPPPPPPSFPTRRSSDLDNLPSSAGHIESGGLRALAVAAPERVPQFPDVPTYAEVGYPELNTPSWYGLAAPANVPEDVLEDRKSTRLNSSHVKISYAVFC